MSALFVDSRSWIFWEIFWDWGSLMANDFRDGLTDALNSAKGIGEKATRAAIKQSLRYAKANPEESKNTFVGAGVGAGIGFAIGEKL